MKDQISIKSILVTVASAIGAIGTFLPWVSASALGMEFVAKGTDGDGWITLMLFAIAIVVALINITKKMPTWAKVTISVVTALALLIVLPNIFNSMSDGLNAGIGMWLIAIASIAAAILPWVPIGDKE